MRFWDKVKNGVYIIAEMSANHAGKLENALAIVAEAKNAGADCLKIQTYTADTMTLNCDNEYFRIKAGLWNGRRLYELYEDAHTPWEWHKAIKDECGKMELDFLSTPFDITATDFLENLGVEFYKIASFELVDIPLIEYVAAKGKPMIISCGMGSVNEIWDAVNACRCQGNEQVVLLKCCSEYPANWGDMNVATIADMRQRFKLPVGLSDHSMGSMASIVAVSLGACVVEKHFCLSRKIKNPDSEFSMEPEEFKKMVSDIQLAAKIGGRVSYDLTEDEKNSVIFRRSLFANKYIKKGEVFTKENISVVRPSYGLSPNNYKIILGRRAVRDIAFGHPIGDEDL